MKPIIIKTEEEFSQSISNSLNSEKLVIIEYTSENCGPCKKIAPLIENLLENPALAHENPALAHETSEFATFQILFLKCEMENAALQNITVNITAIPTFQFYRTGKLVFQFAGANINKLKEVIKNFSV